MSKTIRVIDLLNKIANGEDVPEKIKDEDNIYIIQASRDYFCKDINRYFFEEIIATNSIDYVMNYTAEIIEEQEEIDIQNIEDIKDVFIENSTCGEDVKYLARKYNEILKWAKQLDKKIKEDK